MFSNDTMIQKTIDNVNYLQFRKLNELNIRHCFVLNELNFSFKLQSSEDNYQSFKKVAKTFGFNLQNICRPDQTHSNNVKIVQNNKGLNIDDFQNTDGLITNQLDTPLAITTADCIPIIIYDPIKNVIANIHSGWKGTLNEIIIVAIKKMEEKFNCNFQNLLFFFGPSICQNCFEVDLDVKSLFENKFSYLDNINTIIKRGQIIDGQQKYNIDTVLLNQTLLETLNIPKENMYFANICTCCNNNHIHSYRARKDDIFGLGVTIISL